MFGKCGKRDRVDFLLDPLMNVYGHTSRHFVEPDDLTVRGGEDAIQEVCKVGNDDGAEYGMIKFRRACIKTLLVL